jgi:hypothetical protein
LKGQEGCKYRTVGEAVVLGATRSKHYGTTAKNKNAAKMIKRTMPWSTVVRPVPNVITLMKSVSTSRTRARGVQTKFQGLTDYNGDESNRWDCLPNSREH